MARTPLYALILLLGLGLIAPGLLADDDPGTPAPAKPAEADEPKAGSDGGDEAKPSQPVIKIVVAGTDPKPLRFKPTLGSKFTTSAKLVVGFNVTAMGMGGNMDISVVVDMTVGKGTKAGQYKLSGSFTKCRMAEDPNNPMMGQLKPLFDGLQGITFTGEYSELGKWISRPIENLKGVPPQSANLAQMVAVVFNGVLVEVPEGAVGAGGSWTDDREVTVRGAKMKSQTTYSVEKVEDGKITLSFKDKRTGGAAKIAMMGMQVDLLSSSGEGSGALTLCPGQGIATAGTLKLKNVLVTAAMGNIESSTNGKQETKVKAPVVTGEK